MQSFIELPLSETQMLDCLAWCKDYAYTHALITRNSAYLQSEDHVVHDPFSLLPSPVPLRCFTEATTVQPDLNILLHKVAGDRNFLKGCLNEVIKVDNFTSRLWKVYDAVHAEGKSNQICLELNRVDYMFDYGSDSVSIKDVDLSRVKLQQVEYNTIAAGGATLSQNVNVYHRLMLQRLGRRDLIKYIPDNKPLLHLAKAVETAWQLYGNPTAAVLFVVEDEEGNIYDQRMLEYTIMEMDQNISVVRKTIREIYNTGYLNDDGKLIVDQSEVAIVYFRTCYAPDQFKGNEDWDALLMINRSKAVACPSIGYHLAGTKKVQQVLTTPGVIEKFIENREAVERIRNTFAEQLSLDLTDEGDANANDGINSSQKFVLKPQREGGGNNFFGDDIKTVLTKLANSDERAAFILMCKIHPIIVENYAVRHGVKNIQLADMVSEMGIYGALVSERERILVNEECGYLIRTKPVGTDEGGIATGCAVHDTPYLIE